MTQNTNLNFFTKLSNKIIYYFKWLSSYPMHLGSADYYPSLTRKLDLITNKRINFWTKIAKSYPSFKPFYDKNSSINYMQSKGISETHHYYKEIKNLYENGYALINNFLNTHEHEKILNLFYEKLNNKIFDTSNIYSHVIKEDKINDMIHNKIAPIEDIIFGKKMKQSYILKQISVSEEKSPYKSSVNIHQDRFIPCFKLLYFPTEVKTNPFEYYSGSHFIDEQYIKNAHISATTKAGDNRDKNFNFSGYKEKKFYVRENTLIIAATNGFHRRFHENKDGVRKYVTVSYYNQFTWIDLLKNYLIKKN